MNRRLLCFVIFLFATAACGRPQPWNVLLVTLDTTRADHLGCYGKATARTPNLDRLAGDGILFERAYSAAPVTLPSHSTIFTGTYPPVHGVRDNGLFLLPEDRTTLAEILHDRGYATAAVIGAFPLTREFGVDQGFDFFDDHITIAVEDYRGERLENPDTLFFDERPGSRVNDAILPWLREHGRETFFAWIHYWDPHHPHIPPAPFDQLYAHDLYQGEIAYADHCLGVVLRELEDMGVAERTMVVVVGDHGEGRGEHNEDSHSMLAYNSTLRVPLIMRAPGGPGGGVRVSHRVGTVDILPTILDLLDIPIPEEVQGDSLVPHFGGAAEQPESEVHYAEALSPRLSHGWGELRALYAGDLKYIHGPRIELYDLRDDPDELNNLAAVSPDETARMRAELTEFLDQCKAAAKGGAVYDLDHESRLRLEALGYISVSSDGQEEISEDLRDDGVPPQDRIEDINRQSLVKQKLEARQFLGARDIALELISVDPNNSFNRSMLVLAYLGLGQLNNAAAVAEGSIEVAANNEAAFLNLAQRLFSSGDEERAIGLVQQVVDDQPTAYGTYVLAEMKWQLGDEDEPLRLLAEAIELDPTLHRARLGLAIHLAELGRVDEAESEFQQLLIDHPLHSRGHTNYGLLLLKSGRFEDGLQHLERATELAPDYWWAHIALLAGYVDMGRTDDARRILHDIQARCPDHAVVARAQELTGEA